MKNKSLSQCAAAKAVNIFKYNFQLDLSNLKSNPDTVKPVRTPLNIPAENELTTWVYNAWQRMVSPWLEYKPWMLWQSLYN